ncbi:MAG: hypothetical protein Q4G52_08015 [Clostridia bacterium]|nr:hypothetical protein [Clostridia bacterium]
MRERGRTWAVIAGLLLCAAALLMSVALQRAGYLTYLNSDMASELILARRQVDTGSLIQTDWLYSTEIHILHMNLFYALAFLFTLDYALARIIGNTLVFLLGMGACVFLCRRMRLSWGLSLAVAAMLPAAGSMLYAANMTVAGYYIIHLLFAFGTAGLWLEAAEGDRHGRLATASYAAVCLLQGFLSVRYVLCFVCPMMAAAAVEVLFAPQAGRKLEKGLRRFGAVTALGFVSCVLGYAASEAVMPRLLTSGAGSAASFQFNPLDGQAMAQTLLAVWTDFLKLLGWRGGVSLFSPEGMVNLCVAGVLFLGVMMMRRVYGALSDARREDRLQRRMIEYALAAIAVNLFCFVFVKGTYLNRYLIPAVIFLAPVVGVLVWRESNAWLRAVFLALLCVQVGGSSVILLRETQIQEAEAEQQSAPMMETAAFLLDQGYTHGYGTFWNVRVMQERTQGGLTFTGVALEQAEEGAVCQTVPELIRWLEPSEYTDLDRCPGKTFLLLTQEEETRLAAWLSFADAPRIYQNEQYAVYGFGSSMELSSLMLLGKMKLENAETRDGGFEIGAGGRMRIPTSWREAGSYTLTFRCSGQPQGARIRAYRGRDFELFAEQQLQEGDNALSFELPTDDKYFMLLFTGGEQDGLRVEDVRLTKSGEALQ